ncbi:hypothetical protein QN360_15640 [Glaciimonas sp. CA11.2]|uniref:hypothetical protein n=1 Tax=unclassified Glaciimonas TaxID=2644401 RepID=UPI002AB3B2E1|nr:MULTISPECIES: hypothetical protein [unclassified Glaciimonas]MDY7546893.1 hypothetical protein [Glaciimonas sp. CA11.2]MEB0080452.1 hypothetical protein [Glaciimonas sp. Gout2]MEB0164327.1 hypothetical protein [Glaciimonas sp. CA11.2]
MDVCHGIQTCIDVTQVSNADRGTDTMPTLDIIATERLLRLALTSSQMLADTAARHINRLDSRFRQGLNCPPISPRRHNKRDLTLRRSE